MCNFFSALVLRNGDVLTHPMLDSHSDLVAYYELPDDSAHIERFAKVELVPGDNWLDPETWVWRVDEPTRPEWLDEVEDHARKTLIHRAKQMVITSGEKKLIADGCWILGGDAKVEKMVGGRILRLYGTSSVGTLYGTSSVGTLWGNSRVGTLYGTSSVWELHDTSSVGTLLGNSRVGSLHDNSRVWELHNNSSVGTLYDTSRVGTLHDNSSVGTLRNTR